MDITAGKMPNPLYTTPMVWNSSINPEGVAEHLKYTVGNADFFANLGQFLYQDVNPTDSTLDNTTTINHPLFQIAWQAGLNYRFTTNTSAKIAATFYQYVGLPGSS